MSQDVTLANSLLEQSVLGTGLKSPLTVDPTTNDFARVSGADNVRQCILDLLDTRIGERVMNEDMGADLPEMTFENIVGVVDILPDRIRRIILRYEPRVYNVTVTAAQVSRTEARADITWVLRATGQPGSLVYPYFLELAQGGLAQSL